MSEHRIIRADFASFRHIQGRKILQLVMEVPIEEAEDAFDKLGFPKAGETKWCAIALLSKDTTPVAQKAAEATYHAEAKPVAERLEDAGASPAGITNHRRFSELPLPQQAGIRCQDTDFQWFLMDAYPAISVNSSEPKAIVCQLCNVTTRSEIVHGEPSGDRWRALEAKYQSWLTDRKFAEARR